MASPQDQVMAEKTPDYKSSRTESPHTAKRSHRSRSRSRDRRDRHRDSKKDRDDRRSRERSHRDRRSRSRDRSHRDRDRKEDSGRDRDRERDKDKEKDRERRKERENGESRHRERDRDDKDRRRKRTDDLDDSPETKDKEERSKRKRDDPEDLAKPVGSADGRRSLNGRDRSRDSERRHHRDEGRRRDDEYGHSRKDKEGSHRADSRGDHDRRMDRRPPAPNDPVDPSPRIARPPTPPAPVPIRRASPSYHVPDEPEPEGDSEARSIFVSQLAARLTARDLGYFFEDKLGEGSVRDARIVTDRLSRRSKGIGYVELRSLDHVSRALDLSGTIVMGLPIMVQLTEAERNRVHAGDGTLNLPPGVTAPRHGNMQLYVGSLHFNLTEADIRQVFEPFGELEFVDLHKDPATGRSKGYCFVQYKRPDDAKMALEQMDGFELAGRTLRVNTVHEKGTVLRMSSTTDSLDDSGGGNLNAASRQALMQKLARTDSPLKLPPVVKPNIPQANNSTSVVLRNMFDPEEETEKDWDKELAEDVKTECENSYGKVEKLKVEKDSQGEIYVKFATNEAAKKAIDSLNGRWFGGKQVSAAFISDAIMQVLR